MSQPDHLIHHVPSLGIGLIDPALTAVAFALLLVAAAIGLVQGLRGNRVLRPRMIVALAMWLLGTAYLTMRPGHSGRLNLVPFAFGSHPTLFEPLANVLLFVPLGILVSALAWRLPAVLGIGLGLSLCIEVTQYLLNIGRTADVNDVMENTLGTLVGWIIVLALSHRPRRVATRQGSPGTARR